MLHQLIYASAALPAMTPKEFAAIARHAAQNNKILDVTGILLFSQGTILQVLEGSKDTISMLFDRIKHDPRHSSVMKLIFREINAREFLTWSMGFAEMASEHTPELSFLLTRDSLSEALPDTPSAELRILTDTYARVNGL